MPQMSPIMWFNMFMIFVFIYFILIVSMYDNFKVWVMSLYSLDFYVTKLESNSNYSDLKVNTKFNLMNKNSSMIYESNFVILDNFSLNVFVDGNLDLMNLINVGMLKYLTYKNLW